jgi:hypothetical protein
MMKESLVPSRWIKVGLALMLTVPGISMGDIVGARPSPNFDRYMTTVPPKIDALDNAQKAGADSKDGYNSLTPDQKKVVDELAKLEGVLRGSKEFNRLVAEGKKIKRAGDEVHQRLEAEAKKGLSSAKGQVELADKLQSNPGAGMSSSVPGIVDTNAKVKEATCQGTDVSQIKNAATAFEQYTGKVASMLRPNAEKSVSDLEKSIDDLNYEAKKRRLQELAKSKGKDPNKVLKELYATIKDPKAFEAGLNAAIEDMTEANQKEREKQTLAMYDDMAKLAKLKLKGTKLGVVIAKLQEDFAKHAKEVVTGLAAVRDQNLAALDAMESKVKKDSTQVQKGMKLDGGFSQAMVDEEKKSVKAMIAEVDRVRGTSDPSTTLTARINEHKNDIGKDQKNPDAVANSTVDAMKGFTSEVEAEARKIEKIALACDKLAKKNRERNEEESRAEMLSTAKQGFSERAAQEAQMAQQQQQENMQLGMILMGGDSAMGGMGGMGMGGMGMGGMMGGPMSHGMPQGGGRGGFPQYQ